MRKQTTPRQSKPIPLTRTERKAAQTDFWVKNHLANARSADGLKTSRLRVLRLARDAHQSKGPLSAEVSDELEKLQHQHRAKTLEIEAVVALAPGFGAVEAKEEAENLIQGFENAMMDGKTPKEWQAHEIRVAAAPIGKLLVERYKITEQIADIQDEDPTVEHN
jgi:hypothetical protein